MRQHCEIQLKEAKECESIQTAVALTLSSEIPSVYSVAKSGNIEVVQKYIAAEVAQFCSMLPTARSVSPEAVLNIAKSFSQHPDVRNFSLVELKTFLSLALKRMAFGKLYGGFGYDTLLDWLVQYNNERTERILDYRDSEHAQFTAREKIQRNRNYGDEWGVNDINQIIEKNDNL